MKATSIVIISISLLMIGCQKEQCNCVFEDQLIVENDSIIHSIINQPQNQFQEYWDRFDEPILGNNESESYRFSMIVLLYDFFKVYRIEKVKNDYTLYVKEYAVSTTSKNRKDSLANSIERQISEKQWNEIKEEFERNCFWTMPVDIKEDDGYLDGSGWVLEAKKEENNCTHSNYHLAHRTSPGDTSSFVAICEKFIALDSLKIKSF